MFPKSLDLRPLVENQTVDPNWGGKASEWIFQVNFLWFVRVIDIVSLQSAVQICATKRMSFQFWACAHLKKTQNPMHMLRTLHYM